MEIELARVTHVILPFEFQMFGTSSMGAGPLHHTSD